MTLAVLGTGIMGAAMARNWLKAGQDVRVWNRTREAADALAADGAVVAGSPEEAVAGADVVVTMLFDAPVVEEVMTAAAPGLTEGALWLQMSTVGAEGADALGALAGRLGLVYVDAPVLGTRGPAEQGKLNVLASGPAQTRPAVEELAGPIAAKVTWLGEAGAASRTKLIVNSWVMTTVAATAQSVALADALGIDPGLFLSLIAGGPLDQQYAQLKGAAMMRRDYPVAFPASGAAKDARLVGELGARAGIDTSVVDAARGLLETVVDRGFHDHDMAALYEAVRAPEQ
ncbi:NAD(P)-dependent oxidoreductase [Dactylosporangium sucinum]|uniref:3-hydroxyisobutyrate dehydrogenase n=1 Tax=Dactylosporangium sucinum TaxID=1424081 RepID=A0A917U9J8_9ACTN|nr:NAD(P)-dependent oxidoreductase [Dactylosporangium sucinum]GGM69039.1 3-hydroxyisobutyrate dehydrogenase [Dactylosporangium sucinum]